MFFHFFSSFWFSHFRANPPRHVILLQDSYGLRTCTLFRKLVFSWMLFPNLCKIWSHFCIDFSSNFMFFWHRFLHRFFITFLMENWPKMTPKRSIRYSILGPFFVTFSEHRFLYAFWSPFGSLLAPCWSLLVGFGTLLAPFPNLSAPILIKNHVRGHQRKIFAWIPTSLGPRAEPCRRQLDPLRAGVTPAHGRV